MTKSNAFTLTRLTASNVDPNFQWSTASQAVKNGDPNCITIELEQVQTFRYTWRYGIHSYLAYLRDRLIVARELLNEAGSILFQISDENVHRVRSVMDKVFSDKNFVSIITVKKTTGNRSVLIDNVNDFILRYAKDKSQIKYRRLFEPKNRLKDSSSLFYLDNEQNREFERMSIAESIARNCTEKLFLHRKVDISIEGWRCVRQAFDNQWKGIQARNIVLENDNHRFK